MPSLKVSRITVPVQSKSRRSIALYEQAHRFCVEKVRLITAEPALNSTQAVPHYLHLIQKFSAVRAAASGPGIFAFTSANTGDGVSFVVKSLASALARTTGERVLKASASSLGEGACAIPPSESVDAESGTVYAVKQSGSVARTWEARHLAGNLEEIRRHFGWVLIDCPSLRESDQALALAPHTSGVIFVVAADQTRRADIIAARRSIELASGALLGFVLNKRTYPVPEFLYRRM